MTHPEPARYALPILFEDARMLAVDKPEGLAAIPERDLARPSAQRLLEADRGERLFPVHRLDKEVSGLLLFARDAETHRAISIAFERREVQKRYLALAWGALAVASAGEIIFPIHQFGSGRMGVDARGKASLTRWQALGVGQLAEGPVSLLALEPHTGRRHQLRVHAYAFGHPLVGDPRYGERALQTAQPRLALHASHACVTLGETRYECTAPLPLSLTTLLQAAGVGAIAAAQAGARPNVGSS